MSLLWVKEDRFSKNFPHFRTKSVLVLLVKFKNGPMVKRVPNHSLATFKNDVEDRTKA